MAHLTIKKWASYVSDSMIHQQISSVIIKMKDNLINIFNKGFNCF